MDTRLGIRIAVRAILGHRIRSGLTIVGIVIGIATVIAFASFGVSVQSDIVGEFQSTSASEVYVVSGGGLFTGSGPPGSESGLVSPVITTHDLQQIREIDDTRAVIPLGTVPATSVSYANQTLTGASLTATTPNAFGDAELAAGRSFELGTNELVLNERAAAAFERNVTVGASIEVMGAAADTFTVVGITTGARGGLSRFGPPEPEFFVPVDPHYQTVQTSPTLNVDQRAYSRVTIVAEAGQVSAVREAIETYIQTDSDAARVANEDTTVAVQSTDDVVGGIQSVLQDVTRLITGIGFLALLVGAFGIANIMLISVTERTKEIGIMKAVGASNGDIIQVFLAESVFLGIAGAAIGIPLGLGVGYAGARYAEVGFQLPFGWVGLALLMGMSIGIVAGLYPAWRAARVDPIEALRYE